MEIRKSDSIAKLTEALAAAQLEFKPIKKDSDNPFFKSKYADLSTLIEATRSALAKHSLTVMQIPMVNGQTAGCSTMISHSSGEWLAFDLLLPVAKMDAQGYGSAQTYARRYSYQAALCIAGEDDDDGNAASGKQVESLPKPPKRNVPAENPERSFSQSFWAAARKNGKTESDVREYLGSMGFESTSEIPATRQKDVMEWAAS